VILVSGYNEQDATRRFTGKGLAGFLQKPFQLSALRDVVRDALEGVRSTR
jgi:FixJ family two-component response regulator